METYLKTPRTTPTRLADRASYDVELVHGILDEAYVCHLGFTVDGAPRILPTLHTRIGDTLYLHGSSGSRPMREARGAGLPVCVTVTLIDGLVLARSQFHHSANYRSVVVYGTALLVTDPDEKARAMTAVADKVAAGRAADSRPPSVKELAQTALLAVPLKEVSAKVRSGGVNDDPEDLALPHWAGVVPLTLTAGRPVPDAGVRAGVPAYLQPSPWLTAPTLRGRRLVLAALRPDHAEGLFAALDHPDVWPFLTMPRPSTVDGMAEIIAAALDDPQRIPMIQTHPETGEILGTTSYYAPNPERRCIAIGHTMLGHRWWRTGVNTESKLLLMAHAFETLDVLRLEWHTDIRNERSQRAIARLGAQREGVLRKHRTRADGSWRDTVLFSMLAEEWPAARARLSGDL